MNSARLVYETPKNVPIDYLTISAESTGITSIEFGKHGTTYGGVGSCAYELLTRAAQELDEYFSGQRKNFSLSIDWDSYADNFYMKVWKTLATIPYGARRTYSQIAMECGNARAVRAVGSACARNPWPIIIPCHRIIRSDASLGQYMAGQEMKNFLLSIEQ